MRAHQAVYPVQTMCRVLEVSRSGYCAWRRCEPSARAQTDATLTARIREVHEDSRKTYGSPRIHAELQEEGQRVGRKRVARLMRGAGLEGASRRRFVKTTQRAEDARPAPDLVDRDFSVSGPDQLWVADITYVPTWAGFLYLAVVLDAWSRRVVGWAMATHLRTELVLDALDMALWQRRPEAVIHHSDQGTQGGFKRSSQHLEREELRWGQAGTEERIVHYVRRCVHPVVRRWGAGSTGSVSGRESLADCRARRRQLRSACLPLSEHAGSASMVECHPLLCVPFLGAICRLSSAKRSPSFTLVVAECARSPGN